MTYFVGIDVSKHFHVASIIDLFGVVHLNAFHFNNDYDGFCSFLSHLQSLPKDDIQVGFESTAHYHQNLFNFLNHIHGFACVQINPLASSRFRNLSIRDVKNDNVDSLSIAQFLCFNHSSDSSQDFLVNDLQLLCIARHDLIADRTKLYIQLTAFLDRVFPELKAFFKNNLKSTAAHNLLKVYSTATEIKKARIDTLVKIVSPCSRGYNRQRLESLKHLSCQSIGFHSDAFSLRIKHTLHQIELLDQQIIDIETQILSCMEELNSPILQIPGMGLIQAAYILSAIQNITRFDTPCKVVAFAGLDPKVRQSGQFTAKSCRMSKRGNSLLRYALIWAAHNVSRYSSTMHDYYLKKRSEGKSHYNALGHCAKKLVNYIFFVLTHPDTVFVLD